MKEKSLEKGIGVCPYCGKQDIFYSVIEVCGECFKPIDSKPALKKLQFAIEVYNEFLEKYDEFYPSESKKNILGLSKSLISEITLENKVDNTKLIGFQSICKHIPTVGGNNFGGSVTHASKQISIKEGIPNQLELMQSLSAVMHSINYIINYPVKNEFILKTLPGKYAEIVRSQNAKANTTKNNKGCFGSVFMVIVIIISVIFSVKYLL